MSRYTTPRPPTKYIVLHGYRLRETDKAVQFEVHKVGDDDELPEPKREWFPFSQMRSQKYSHDGSRDEFDNIEVSEWIVGQKELS